MGVTIDELIVGDPPDAWEAAGFRVDDDGTCRIGSVRVRLVGREQGKRILGWSLRDTEPGGLPGDSLDGIPTTVSGHAPAEPGDHPNGTLLIDHVVLITPDLARTVASLERIGLDVRGTRDSDTYGAPMRQTFFRMGETILELIGAVDKAGEGDAGFFGLAHTVDDIDATAALLAPHIGDIKDAVQPGRRIVTLRHKEFGMSVATAFMSPEPAPE